jgi:hypothetical protein
MHKKVLNIVVFWDVTTCSLVDHDQLIGGSYYLSLHDGRIICLEVGGSRLLRNGLQDCTAPHPTVTSVRT